LTSKLSVLYAALILIISPILYKVLQIESVFLNSTELEILGRNVPLYIGVFFFFLLITIFIINIDRKYLISSKSLPKIISPKKILLFYPIMTLAAFWFLVNNFTLDLYLFNENRAVGNKGEGLIIYFIAIVIPNVLGFKMLSDGKLKFWLVFLFLLFSSSSMLVGFRGPFISNIMFLWLIRYKLTNRWFKKSDFKYFILFIAILGLYGGIRNSNFEINSFDTLTFLQSTIIRVSSFELIGIMDNYVSINGFDYFAHNIRDDIWIMIPRDITGYKPISLSEVIANDVYSSYLNLIGIFKEDDYGGVSYTAIGEGLYNAGMFGVALYGIVLGFLFSISDKLINSNSWILFNIGKGIFVNIIGMIEATQLGINSLIMNVITSIIILHMIKK